MLYFTEPLPRTCGAGEKIWWIRKEKFPYYNVRTYVVYICANKGWKCWEV